MTGRAAAMMLTVPVILATCLPATVAAQIAQSEANSDPFAFLARESRPLVTRHAIDYRSMVELGARYTSDDNFTFGQYNGRHEDGFEAVIGADLADWRAQDRFGGFADYWRLSAVDLASDVRQVYLEFGRADDYTVHVGYDQQLQVRNDSGRTPFRGGDTLLLPADWVSASTTGEMSVLTADSRDFDQELERKRFDLRIDKRLGDAWDAGVDFSHEEKTGTQTLGGALYVDAANGHAVVMPKDVDSTTSRLELSGAYTTAALNLALEYLYSEFDNDNEALTWQNPYGDVFGAGIDYPDGFGAAAYEPDNETQRLRGYGSYRFSPKLRFVFDGSVAKTEQDASFLPFTTNSLPGVQPLPRGDLNGEVETRTFDGKAHYRPWSKLALEANYHFEERSNDSPRDGYRYVRGDAWAPDDPKFTVYNTAHDRTINRVNVKGTYRLPRASKLTFAYAYEEVERSNAAVEETEEDRYTVTLRSRLLDNLNGRLDVQYADRAADTYEWGQSFYALLDTRLINEIPDNQRYITHPELSQFHLANREQWQAKAHLTYTPAPAWALTLDANYQDSDFNESSLGLTEQTLTHVSLGGQWSPGRDLDLSVFYSYDHYEADQGGRSFRGGAEKNAFEVFPPLPQASDPARDWTVSPDDETHSVGIDARWRVVPDRIELEAAYHFSDSQGSDDFTTFGAADILGTPLPDIETTLHDLSLVARYHYSDQISIQAEYRYYDYERDDWALDGVELDTIDKVITPGEANPDDDISFLMLTLTYRIRE